MALSITHNAVVVTADDPSYEVGSNEWNALHTISGVLGIANGGTGASSLTSGALTYYDGSTFASSPLFREDANTIAQRNSTTAQALRVYNTYTDGSNYERGAFDWSTSSNVLTIGTQNAGTGTGRNVSLVTAGGEIFVNGATNVAPFSNFGAFSTFQVVADPSQAFQAVFAGFGNNATGASNVFIKSRNATLGSHTTVQNGDGVGNMDFYADNGTDYNSQVAGIRAVVDGVPSATSMPGRLEFLVTPSGAVSFVACWKISNAGHLLAVSDSTYNIGADGATRPQNLYLANALLLGAKAVLSSPGDGKLNLQNSALNDWGLLQFGGTSSSYPALKRSSAALQVRLADDSAFSDLSLGTTGVLSAGTIELGHASDTTISRTGAGAIAVEGVGVALNSTSLVHTCSTLEVGNASDTTLSRAAAGQVAVEGDNLLRTTADIAAQADQETATSTTKWVSPARQHFHPAASKCWGFTTGGGSPSLNAVAYNMTSITDTATGRLTVTIGNDFSSSAYVVVFGATTTNSTTASRIIAVNTKAAGSFEIDSYSAVTPTLADVVVGFDWACFGDL